MIHSVLDALICPYTTFLRIAEVGWCEDVSRRYYFLEKYGVITWDSSKWCKTVAGADVVRSVDEKFDVYGSIRLYCSTVTSHCQLKLGSNIL